MTEKTKIVKVKGVEYTIKRFTFGERNAILDATSSMDMKGLMILKTGTLRAETLKQGILKPNLNDKQINDLDDDVGVELYREIQKFNGATVPLRK